MKEGDNVIMIQDYSFYSCKQIKKGTKGTIKAKRMLNKEDDGYLIKFKGHQNLRYVPLNGYIETIN